MPYPLKRYGTIFFKGDFHEKVQVLTRETHTVLYNGHEVRLTSFKVEIARARRVCTNCRSSIPTKQPCVKAKIIATQIERTASGQMWRWSEMVQLCHTCVESEHVNKYHEKFKGSQTPAQLSNLRVDFNTKLQEYLSQIDQENDYPSHILANQEIMSLGSTRTE